ncbi:hypothetical protein NDU88_006094 [Pleurodeles waltl]|uniref:Uncharacterized protein n=1 Tax=Pleurodeles waltl TaxID=8319 RepID=A0AAV7UKX6_PLEWA|nr:hypothetical protein NDU88_006094 [Pleurodeles waltl]
MANLCNHWRSAESSQGSSDRGYFKMEEACKLQKPEASGQTGAGVQAIGFAEVLPRPIARGVQRSCSQTHLETPSPRTFLRPAYPLEVSQKTTESSRRLMQ